MLHKQLESGGRQFYNALTQIQQNQPEKRLLIIADQFGELFTSECSDDIRCRFINNFTNYIKSSGNSSQIIWIVTITSADLDSAYSYSDLWALLSDEPNKPNKANKRNEPRDMFQYIR